MKNNKTFFTGVALLLNIFTIAPALATKEVGNGGDICEDHFITVRDDIRSWISKGGSEGLILPHGLTVAEYNSKMDQMIGSALVSCVDAAIMIDGAEKTCKNFIDSSGTAQIICNSQRFNQTNDSDQYVLVHHEYAGLSGFEVNNGEQSQYFISNQISGYLEDVVVKKLALKPRAPVAIDPNNLFSSLKSAFDAAGPVRIGDIPLVLDQSFVSMTRGCVGVGPNGQDIFGEFGRVDFTPDDGPLASGATISWVNPFGINDWTDHPNDISTQVNSSGDLETIAKLDGSCANTVITVIYRASGDLIFLHQTASNSCQFDTPTEIYAYSFPRN
jgi:hypothetical protein